MSSTTPNTRAPMPPSISGPLAKALCRDDYTGMPALDDDAWQGASDSARSSSYEETAFCYDDDHEGEGTERLMALDEHFCAWVWDEHHGYWDAQ